MKAIAWILDMIVNFTLIVVLLFDRRSYQHCISLDG